VEAKFRDSACIGTLESEVPGYVNPMPEYMPMLGRLNETIEAFVDRFHATKRPRC